MLKTLNLKDSRQEIQKISLSMILQGKLERRNRKTTFGLLKSHICCFFKYVHEMRHSQIVQCSQAILHLIIEF